jgi:hypothetical protein
MALQSTADFAAEYSDSKKDLPATPEGHPGYHCLIGHVEGRTLRKDGNSRRIIEVFYVCAMKDAQMGVEPGAVHTETYWIDDKNGNEATVPRRILTTAIIAANDGDEVIDMDIADTIAAVMLGRYVRVRMKENGTYGPQTAAVLAPKDRAKAQAALREFDADLCDRLDTRRAQLYAKLLEYRRTNTWPGTPAPATGGGFSDDHVPLTPKTAPAAAPVDAIDSDIPF